MNAFRGSSFGGGPSKATAATLCQKCLKRDIYECKAVAQERPYVARPSRTQQLLNPKLVPKLASDVPQDLLRKTGVADEVLAKAELERGRKRDRQSNDGESSALEKRLRPSSVTSSTSISTISTNNSRPSSGGSTTNKQDKSASLEKIALTESERKRRRRSYSFSSSDSYSSGAKHGQQQRRNSSRSIRRKIGDSSPPTRGRRRSRSGSRNRRPVYSSDGSYSRSRPVARKSPSLDSRTDRRRSRSPVTQQRRTRSPDDRSRNLAEFEQRGGTKLRNYGSAKAGYGRGPPALIPQKERSLSPFSRRVALTRSMNTGR